MKTYINPPKEEWPAILKRPQLAAGSLDDLVTTVFKEVKNRGDEAILEYTALYDKVQLDHLIVSDFVLKQAASKVSSSLKAAIDLAKENITKFHKAQRTERITVETSPGVLCWQEKRPIQEVGVYVPGGTAPLISTVLMLLIPAKIAECKEMVLCTPPDKNGEVHPAILYAAQLCGATKIIKAGGIQAIAGLTFGTKSIPRVSKIFGPGNQYVTAAKQYGLKHGIAIDMPAGPSELMVVVDDTAIASFVASDLLSQAEHGIDSQVICLSFSKPLLIEIENEIDAQLSSLSRATIAKQALEHARFIYLEQQEEGLNFINAYAPEHLILCVENEAYFAEGVANAGSVFLGNYTPESAGDYASGTNHTLPTNGFARQYSGVNLDSFLKSMTFQKISKEGLVNIGDAIEELATAEGLDAHKNAVSIRLAHINNER